MELGCCSVLAQMVSPGCRTPSFTNDEAAASLVAVLTAVIRACGSDLGGRSIHTSLTSTRGHARVTHSSGPRAPLILAMPVMSPFVTASVVVHGACGAGNGFHALVCALCLLAGAGGGLSMCGGPSSQVGVSVMAELWIAAQMTTS